MRTNPIWSDYKWNRKWAQREFTNTVFRESERGQSFRQRNTIFIMSKSGAHVIFGHFLCLQTVLNKFLNNFHILLNTIHMIKAQLICISSTEKSSFLHIYGPWCAGICWTVLINVNDNTIFNQNSIYFIYNWLFDNIFKWMTHFPGVCVCVYIG